mmetsp:Transcript_10492/g.26887  ORF Transcript_10492/g.26887 Transcript_10492/m.26887 type:complete len:307 (+) Transcript_10492:78-998(+)
MPPVAGSPAAPRLQASAPPLHAPAPHQHHQPAQYHPPQQHRASAPPFLGRLPRDALRPLPAQALHLPPHVGNLRPELDVLLPQRLRLGPFALQLLGQRAHALARVRLVLQARVQQLVAPRRDVGQRLLQLHQHLPQLQRLLGCQVDAVVLRGLQHKQRAHHCLGVLLLQLRVGQDALGHLAQVDLGLQRLQDVQVGLNLLHGRADARLLCAADALAAGDAAADRSAELPGLLPPLGGRAHAALARKLQPVLRLDGAHLQHDALDGAAQAKRPRGVRKHLGGDADAIVPLLHRVLQLGVELGAAWDL